MAVYCSPTFTLNYDRPFLTIFFLLCLNNVLDLGVIMHDYLSTEVQTLHLSICKILLVAMIPSAEGSLATLRVYNFLYMPVVLLLVLELPTLWFGMKTLALLLWWWLEITIILRATIVIDNFYQTNVVNSIRFQRNGNQRGLAIDNVYATQTRGQSSKQINECRWTLECALISTLVV